MHVSRLLPISLVVLAAWLVQVPALAASTGTLAGKVVEKATGKPVANATIRIVELKAGGSTRTGSKGRYELTGVPPGTQKAQLLGGGVR